VEINEDKNAGGQQFKVRYNFARGDGVLKTTLGCEKRQAAHALTPAADGLEPNEARSLKLDDSCQVASPTKHTLAGAPCRIGHLALACLARSFLKLF